MITFLDFHNTVFNSAAYDAAVRSGETSPELSQFVYPDAVQTLKSLENNGVVITSAPAEFVKAALAHIPRITFLATEGKSKAEYLALWPGYYGQEAVFVDDSVADLLEVSQKYPALECIEMRRDGLSGEGSFKVVTSLSQLP
ncbi:hypothetical protein KJ819_00545 [Patescibacteria group bacterium]|nr:hypothetical protein [Patescibacteria group bacterium]MBU1501125.1 hypothetical protein [Patescibacteria group bacterium]MBU2081002.1 hypothetical protein [Patescibacteria group bacterium]MBU2124094.1 hypothetical protein [Patescibacteria group bacterium]MBU2194949.1 hypothetical protein [Patescibacteria group bacterium]